MSYLIDDAGISIGLLSLPIGYEKQYFQEEIKDSLFKDYKQELKKNFSEIPSPDPHIATEFESDFYEPKPYYLFGAFDLAVLSLVDDFELGCRTFRPFDPMAKKGGPKPYLENVVYKVITGVAPKTKPNDSVVDLSSRTFRSDETNPLFAISLLKINTAILIGCGVRIIEYVLKYINMISNKKLAGSRTNFIVLQSYSWHEISLLLFSNSYREIGDFLVKIREITLQDLESMIDEEVECKDSCLISKIISLRKLEKKVESAHIFTESETNFGFDFDLFCEEGNTLLERISSQDEISFLSRWFVKPGHLEQAIKTIFPKSTKPHAICIGRGDILSFVPPCCRFSGADSNSEEEKTGSTKTNIEELIRPFKQEKLNDHIVRAHTIPLLKCPSIHATGVNSDHFYVVNELQHLKFLVTDIKKTQDQLRKLRIPKIVAAKVLNMFSNYNDGCLDRKSYGYFVELRPFMDSIRTDIESCYKNEIKYSRHEVIRMLTKATDNFERAYRNRFHNSYRMGEITDFNIEFKGGIQQLITAFDSAYKALSSYMGNEDSFVYVSGEPGVYSTSYELRLNYFHIYQPEIFISIAMHESAHFMLSHRPEKIPRNIARHASHVYDDELIKQLEFIRNDLEYPEKELSRLIDRNFCDYFVVDLIVYYFTYNLDEQLFSYWYWGYLCQMPILLADNGEYDEVEFLRFLIRMMTIIRAVDSRVFGNASSPFGKCELNELWDKWIDKMRRFIDNLFEYEGVKQWFDDVHLFVQDRYIEAYKDNVDNSSPRLGEEKIDAITESVKNRSFEFIEKLKNGEICYYEEKGKHSAFQFTQALSYGYLRLLLDEFGNGKLVLTRNWDFGGQPEIKTGDSDLLFDPLGGMFSHDPVTRRRCFKYRSGVILSFWDMGMKCKRDRIMSLLRD